MVDLERPVRMLRAQRAALLKQLDAIDTALAALTTAEIALANTRQPDTAAAEEATNPVLPTQVKPRRVLSDEHRQASVEGRRKARQVRDAAAGRVREPGPTPGLARASTAARLPRLVKREKRP